MSKLFVSSNKVIDHYRNPRNCGVIDEPTAIGELGDPDKGVTIKFFLSIKNNCVKDIKFQTFGCITSIASASILTELAKGSTLDEVSKFTAQDVSRALNDIPPEKMYCCELAIGALKNGVKNILQPEADDDRN